MNRIIKASVTYIKPEHGDGYYVASVTKEFAPEHGGGTEVFMADRSHSEIHYALEDLKGMVTLSPGSRTGSNRNSVADFEPGPNNKRGRE